MSKPVLLDLFCCAGGAAVGYHRAGFEIVGIDINPQPNYPFFFAQTDALKMPAEVLSTFDAVHASPPCQAYSDLAKRNGNGDDWPKLIEPVRDLLSRSGVPFIIENVDGAPLKQPTVLCGTMFEELRVLRHRLFETTFPVTAPEHRPHPKVHTFDRRKSHYGKTDEWRDYVMVTGGGNCTIAAAHDAMGIDWCRLTKREINESIPPAYSQFIGQALLEHWQVQTMSSKARIRQFLLSRLGQVVTAKQLQDAAGSSVTEWARRLREVRSDDGWAIKSHHDDQSLKPGEYRLESAPSISPQAYKFARRMSARTRALVLERNGFTCQMCGAGAGDPDDANPGRVIRLHVGHIIDHEHGGSDDVANLRALCSACNQGAQDRAPAPPDRKRLLGHIRRANVDDQQEALKWLKHKFSVQRQKRKPVK